MLVAALRYAGLVFAIGSVTGTVREIALTPAFGSTVALAIDTAVMVPVSFLVARLVLAGARLPHVQRLATGWLALLVLVALEDLTAHLLVATDVITIWAARGDSELTLTLIGLGAFAIAPAFVQVRGSRPAGQ